LLQNFLHCSQEFRNLHKILCCFDTLIQVLQEKVFWSKYQFSETFKPNSQEAAQI
jgi:hypothetical protein